MYEAFCKRQMVEELKQRKLMLIQALYSNSNYDDPEARRGDKIREIEETFKDMVESIYRPHHLETSVEDDPFYAAMRVAEPPKE